MVGSLSLFHTVTCDRPSFSHMGEVRRVRRVYLARLSIEMPLIGAKTLTNVSKGA